MENRHLVYCLIYNRNTVKCDRCINVGLKYNLQLTHLMSAFPRSASLGGFLGPEKGRVVWVRCWSFCLSRKKQYRIYLRISRFFCGRNLSQTRDVAQEQEEILVFYNTIFPWNSHQFQTCGLCTDAAYARAITVLFINDRYLKSISLHCCVIKIVANICHARKTIMYSLFLFVL